jgi:hypothetical protein
VNSRNGGAYLQNCLGGLRVSCGGATWRAAVGCADVSVTQAMTPAVNRARGPDPPVHGGPPKGYAAPFNLDRPPRSDGPNATQAAAAAGGARRRSSPAMDNLASRAPNSTGDGPKARGGQKELTGGLGKEGGAP